MKKLNEKALINSASSSSWSKSEKRQANFIVSQVKSLIFGIKQPYTFIKVSKVIVFLRTINTT